MHLKYFDMSKINIYFHFSLFYKCKKVVGKIVLFLVFLLSPFFSFAQRDQITTQAGEKIRCRILDETSMKIIYAYVNTNGKILRTEIFKNLISDYKYNVFSSDLITKGQKLPEASKTKPSVVANLPSAPKQNTGILSEKVLEKDKKVVSPPKFEAKPLPIEPSKNQVEEVYYPNFRIGVKWGIANMLDKIATASDYTLYQEKYLRGFSLGADFLYFVHKHFGIGFTYLNYLSRNSSNSLYFKDDLLKIEGEGNVSGQRSISFLGPSMYFRKKIDFKTLLMFGITPGINSYREKGNLAKNTYQISGKSFGVNANLGVDFLLGNDILGRNLILSLESGYNDGKLKERQLLLNGKSSVLTSPFDLRRLDFTVGLRLSRFP